MSTPDPRLTLVVPVREPSPELLGEWAPHAQLRCVDEVIVVRPRGGAASVCPDRAGVRLIEAPLGRASQMNAGAAAARGDFVFFVHGDTRVDADAIHAILAALRADPGDAAALSLKFDSDRRSFRVLEWMSRVRDRVFPFPLGDQGLAVGRSRFRELGAFPDEPLFEDVIVSGRLRRAGSVRVLPELALTDADRFERRGVWRHFAHNLLLVAWHALGASPRTLVRHYYGRAYLEGWLAADPRRRGGEVATAPTPSPSS